MAHKRRYKDRGEHPVYDDYFDRLRVESQILNRGDQRPGVHSIIYDENNLKALQMQMVGNKDGQYHYPETNEWRIAELPNIQRQMNDLQNEFEDYQQRCINEGREKPEVMPPEMQKKRFHLEAKEDVLREEIAEIEGMLETFREQDAHRESNLLLKYGPIGSNRLRDGIVCEMDGQRVGQTEEGLLIIKDEASPYNGMAVVDYRGRVSKRWALAKYRIETVRNRLLKKLAEKGQREEFEEQWKVERAKLMKAHPEWQTLFTLKLPGKPAMPSWPQKITNHLKQPETKK